MINDRVRPQSQSYASARRLAFRVLGLAAFAVAACAAGAASAQGNLKIGVINVGKLLENAPQSKVVSDRRVSPSNGFRARSSRPWRGRCAR